MFTLREVDVEAVRKVLANESDCYKGLEKIPPEQIGRNRHFSGIGMTDIAALPKSRGSGLD